MTFLKEAYSLPSIPLSQKPASKLRVSFLIPAYHYGRLLERTVLLVWDYLSRQFPDDFEIIIIPNGTRVGGDQTYEVSEALARRFPEIKVVPHESPQGKDAALRTNLIGGRIRDSVIGAHPIYYPMYEKNGRFLFFTKVSRLLGQKLKGRRKKTV